MKPQQQRDRDIVIKLSAEDRRLILTYGYPFDRIKRDILALANDRRDRLLAIDPFELEHLIGNLSHSTNHSEDGDLVVVLNDLCERLEWEERRHEPPRR